VRGAGLGPGSALHRGKEPACRAARAVAERRPGASGDGDTAPGPPGESRLGPRRGEGPGLPCKAPAGPGPAPRPLLHSAPVPGKQREIKIYRSSLVLICFIIAAVASRWHFHITQTLHQPSRGLVALPQALVSFRLVA